MSAPEDEREDLHGECAVEIAALTQERDALAVQLAQAREHASRIVGCINTTGGPANRDAAGNWVCWPAWADGMERHARAILGEVGLPSDEPESASIVVPPCSCGAGSGHCVSHALDCASVRSVTIRSTSDAALSTPAPRVLTVEQVEGVVARVFDRTTTAWPLKTTIAAVIDEVLNG